MLEQGMCQHLNKTWHKAAGIYYWSCPDCQREHYCESFGAVMFSLAAGGHLGMLDNGNKPTNGPHRTVVDEKGGELDGNE